MGHATRGASSSPLMQLPPIQVDAKRLILVRHGSVSRRDHNPPIQPGALYGGNLEVPLSAKGEQEAASAAAAIGEYVKSSGPDAVQLVTSSPMERAVFGAEAIAAAVQ